MLAFPTVTKLKTSSKSCNMFYLHVSKKCLDIWFVFLSPSQTGSNKTVRYRRQAPHTFYHKSGSGLSEFPQDIRHKLQQNINPVSGRMLTPRLKILTCLINFKANFVMLLQHKFTMRGGK